MDSIRDKYFLIYYVSVTLYSPPTTTQQPMLVNNID